MDPVSGDLASLMREAIAEAALSLREGNHGFGALIVRDGQVIARTHDTEETDRDPTAHAESKAIRMASARIGKNLSDCTLVSTHEPCPMCAAAIVWSKLAFVAYGCGIAEAIGQARNRIDIECREIFRRARADIRVESGLLGSECGVLYDESVRAEIKRLRGATDVQLGTLNDESKKKRLEWYRALKESGEIRGSDPLERAYRVLLLKLGIGGDQAPIVKRTEKEIVFHSKNRCPTLEACKILGLDTRRVCKLTNEGSTRELIRQEDPGLDFIRNYEKIRPYREYCEEIIRFQTADGEHAGL